MAESFLDACELAAMVRRGEVSPIELVDDAVDRIERLDPSLNAVIRPRFEQARREAGGALPDGPFRGVPIVLKDLLCSIAGEEMHEGMAALKKARYVAPRDQELTRRLRAAGFVVVGRTNTPELGILPTTEPVAYGPSRNPWDTTRSTGGSSGGSAAAVASGMVPVAHASDGGGSIRIPASECGLVGLKPTRARVSLGPEYGDVIGGLVCELAVTRSVRDTAEVLDAVAGPTPGDPYAAPDPVRPFGEEVGADPGRLRIGVQSAAFGGSVTTHPDCVAAAEAAARLLESAGHHVEPVHVEALDDTGFVTNFVLVWAAGMAFDVDHYWPAHLGRALGAEDVEPLTWALADVARAATASDFLAARHGLQTTARAVARWYEDGGFDLLLTPTIAEPPPPLGEFDSPPDNPLHGLFRAAELV
ncbi:MAG: amidase, partial [Acidimicrobiales bacterium]